MKRVKTKEISAVDKLISDVSKVGYLTVLYCLILELKFHICNVVIT
jgi:hypothetical protein